MSEYTRSKSRESSCQQRGYSCHTCSATLDDEKCPGIICEFCLLKWCIACLDMEVEDYNVLLRRSDFHWYCSNCEEKVLGQLQVSSTLDEQVKTLSSVLQEECEKLMKEVKNSNTEQEKINNKVVQEIKEIKDAMKEQTTKTTRSWADLFKTNQNETKKVIEETINEKQTTLVKEALDSSRQKMDSDHVERERRKTNVIIKDVPESMASNIGERIKADRQVIIEILNVTDDEIYKVVRAGPPSKDNTSRKSRPLIVTMSTPELACSLHDYGRGRKVTNQGTREELWINPDLILADRVANYNARLARRKPKMVQQDTTQAAVDNLQPHLQQASEVPNFLPGSTGVISAPA